MAATVLVQSDVSAHARELAAVASVIAREASQLALTRSGDGHTAGVARRAARQAHEAAEQLVILTERADATPKEALRTATWALSAAAVALTQAKLNAPKDEAKPYRQRCVACGKVSYASTQRGAVVFRHRHKKLCAGAEFADAA